MERYLLPHAPHEDFASFPLDVMLHCLLSRLCPFDLVRLRTVCRRLKSVCDRDELWKRFFEEDFMGVCSSVEPPLCYLEAYFFYAKHDKLLAPEWWSSRLREPYGSPAVSCSFFSDMPGAVNGFVRIDSYYPPRIPVGITQASTFRLETRQDDSYVIREIGRPRMLIPGDDNTLRPVLSSGPEAAGATVQNTVPKAFCGARAFLSTTTYDYSMQCKAHKWAWPYVSRRMIANIAAHATLVTTCANDRITWENDPML